MCKKIFLIAIFGLSLVSKVSLAEETELHFIGVTKPEEKVACSIYANVEEQKLCVLNSSIWKMLIAGVEKDGADSGLRCHQSPLYVGVHFEADSYSGFRVRTTCLGWNGLAGDLVIEIVAEGRFVEGLPIVFEAIFIHDKY